MGKYIAVFSGQGSQYMGMGKSLYESSKKAKDIFDCGSDILGYDLADICFNGVEDELNKTVKAQPAIFAHSLAAYYSVLENLSAPDFVVGHSLGEFAALQAAGAFSIEAGFKIIKARAEAMQEAAERSAGSMAAILRVDYDAVEKACNAVDGMVLPVNLNTAQQTVISGETEAVDKAIDLITAENKRARAMKLAVKSAFHTIMMETAAKDFESGVKNVEYSKTNIPFISNVTGEILEIENYPEYFAKHMVSPVRFTDQCKTMETLGATKAIEFGPKKVVAGLISKNLPSVEVKNVDTIEDVQNL